MIKRILLVSRAGEGDDFAAAWRAAMGAARSAPPAARPTRVSAGTVLPEFTPDSPHDGIGLQWFTDLGHLQRFEAWLAAPQSTALEELFDQAVDPASSQVVVAQEHVLRGEEWLLARWRDGGEKLKQMAVARRADGLTPAAFSERWRNRAGSVGEVPIPQIARGQAYAQNHPLPKPVGDWPYDALNEVYFDHLDGLRTRIAWFEENFKEGEEDLVRESWFLAVREEIL
jgi:hypothetical protein